MASGLTNHLHTEKVLAGFDATRDAEGDLAFVRDHTVGTPHFVAVHSVLPDLGVA